MCMNMKLICFNTFNAKNGLETFGSSCGKSTNFAAVVCFVLSMN